jgi:hypothetical protein
MKRLFIFFMVLALSMSLTGAALAAGPKAACFQLGAFSDVIHLTFKALGTMKTSAGKVKVYAVNGEDASGGSSVPLVGTAHIQSGTTIVHFSVAGQTDSGGGMLTYQFEGFWDTAVSSLPFPQFVGTMNFRVFFGGGALINSGNGLGLFSADCTAPPAFPYDGKALGDPQ